MREVIIKSINRKTTISKAAIRRAAEIAYGQQGDAADKSKKGGTKKSSAKAD